jgi:deoxyuridine 5'-triphosphate nucleotidohydrolase
MGNFIHPQLVTQLGIPTKPCPKPLELQTVTGAHFYHVKKQVTLLLTIQHGHEETITLNIAPVGKHDIILGLPWCKYHRVQFDWTVKDILAWSPNCKGRCFPTPISTLQVRALCHDAIIPKRSTPRSIRYDLHTTETITIPPARRAPVTTGLSIKLPPSTYGRIMPQSGLAIRHNIDVAARVIDRDFRGEMKAVLVNHGMTPYQVQKGDCITQLVLESAQVHNIQQVTELDQTDRGADGFSSTGMSLELAEIYAITLGHMASSKIQPMEEQYRELHAIIPKEYHNYLDVFDADLAMSACPPTRPSYDFEIHLQENAKLPPPHCPYHLSQAENATMKEWLDGMLETGMISRCTTKCPTAAPVFFVGKKDGTKRPVIDYCRLNDVTIRDSYPLPHINQIMDQVKGSRYFSKFDMKSGYNQLCIKEGHEWMTAFITPHGVFQLNVMTFGFMNAPLVFQRFMDDLLYRQPKLVNSLVGYLDDANTHSTTMDDHVRVNRAFFERCQDAGITLNPKKCEFHKDWVDFLGVELLAEGFEMEHIKVEAI